MFEQVTALTAEAFEKLALEDQDNKILEFIGGEIHVVPSNAYASKIAVMIATLINVHVMQNDIAHVTGADGGYRVFGERYAPDVGVVLKSRQTELDGEGYNRLPPDLAVEVEHPVTTASAERLTVKVANYLSAGTTVWVIYPERKAAVIYAPGRAVRVLHIDDSLDGGDVLPGLSIPLRTVFGG
ncbi:MAG: Uma2 family endonuclease [Chloroflexi bacterium]|nr:Uma2 family endonuclease [Chloroflexota bacterium]